MLTMRPSASRVWQFLDVRPSVVASLVLLVSAIALLRPGLEQVQSAVAVLTPTPQVRLLDVPPQVFVGEDFTFFVAFDNSTAGSVVGFAPFVDLVLDSGGADRNNPPPPAGGPCDGIQLVKAELADVTGNVSVVTPLPNAAPCTTTPAQLAHPFGGAPFGPVSVPPGAELRTIILPYGSYQPTQSEIRIKVTAHVHQFADVNHQLKIYARAGFRLGADPQNNPISDPPVLTDSSLSAAAWGEQGAVSPTVFVVGKKYLHPEAETVTGPNFPRQYEITVDVATGQTINNLVVGDCLQTNMQFVSVVSSTPAQLANTPPTSTSPCLQLIPVSLTGAAGPDVTVVFSFFIRKNVGPKPVLSEKNCQNAISVDDVKAEGDWTPLDPRDGPGQQHVVSDVSAKDHSITDKRLAVQKSVETHPVPNAPVVPGSFLKYTLSFQVSDFFTVGQIEVEDILSDGQGLITLGSLAPKLTVSDQTGPTPTAVSFTPGPHGPSLYTQLDAKTKCVGVQGGRRTTFRVSTAMRNSASLFTSPTLQSGVLTGGHASGPPSNVPATGQIVFYARVLDSFVFGQPPGDKFVDKHDPLFNCVNISAEMISGEQLLGFRCGDDSGTRIDLPGGALDKTVYARNGSTTDPELSNSPPRFAAGDTITFRIRQTIPSGDFENLRIGDWLPVPVLQVGGLVPGPLPACTAPPPAPAVCRFMPGHTLTATPALAVSPADNSFSLNYGSGNDPGNQPKTIDLLVSLTVSTDPFADHLFLTNQTEECEQNTFGGKFCQRAFAQFELTEPHVRIRKGVVATNNPNSFFSPTPPGPGPAGVSFTAQTTPGGSLGAPIWWPPLTINSNSVTHPNIFNSDLSNADAGDWITFAILLENRGSGLNGAYDVKVKDAPAAGFVQPAATYVLPAHDGTGATFNLAPPGVFALMTSAGQELVDPGPTLVDAGSLDRYSPTGGRNLVVITYNMQLKTPDKITIGECLDNTAELLHYTASEGGPNFAAAAPAQFVTDRARVCINPTLTKSVVATSEAHTAPETSALGTPQVAVGEIVRYRLVVRLPEGSAPSFQLTDDLPPGMKFMNDSTARLAFISTNGTGITHPSLTSNAFNVSGNESTLATLALTPPQTIPASAISVGPNCGDAPTFDLGHVQNNDNDADLEFVVLEFNALVWNLPANQQPLGQAGATLPDTFSVSVDGDPVATSNTVGVSVVEPNLALTKTAAPGGGGLANFTVSLTNTGAVAAFDVQVADALPTGLSLASTPAPAVSVAPANCAQPTLSVAGNALTVGVPSLPASPSCTVTLTFAANVPNTCPPPPHNVAQVGYTSLPAGGTPVGAPGNNAGSVTPGATGAADGERPYNTSTWAAVPNNCQPVCAPQPPGMVSWWPLNEQASPPTKVVDDIKGANDGTPLPGGSIGLPNGPAPRPGKVSTGLFIAMIPPVAYSNVSVPDHPSLKFGTGNLTIDAWFSSSRSQYVIVGIVDKLDIAAKTGYAFYVEHNRLKFVMGDGVSFTPYVSTSQVSIVGSPTPSWHHVAVTVDRVNGGIFYIDGAPAGTFTPLAPGINISSNSALLIGGSRFKYTSPECVCEYTLDEVEIFNSVVSPAAIKGMFDGGSVGKCP